jgi:hypothetical protein
MEGVFHIGERLIKAFDAVFHQVKLARGHQQKC